jgi:NAD(P)-dependent dehydrogenase (short-subunit alcohol dehydrogenase family)
MLGFQRSGGWAQRSCARDSRRPHNEREGIRFRGCCPGRFLTLGVFDAQNIISIPHVRLVRRLGVLTSDQMDAVIVNVSSMAGALGIGTSAPYIASKGALNALTLNMARMLAPHVRVNAVCPGLILSRWFASGAGEGGMELLKSQYERAVPLERASTPGEVADAVIWLIDGAATMTGELLLLDSGMHLGKGLSKGGV